MFAPFWLLAALQFLVTREPVPADPMVHAFNASCGGTHVRVEGHGLALPRTRMAQVWVNRQLQSGSQMLALQQDLSSQRSVYRLVALCDRSGEGLQLQIYVGEAGPTGEVSYRTGSATFTRRGLHSYSGLSPAEADSFWFR